MRCEAHERGVIESGFQRVEDGWHIVKFNEGIDLLRKKDKDGGEIEATNKQGDKLWKFPLVVEDDEDNSNGVGVDVIAAENKKGEQMVTDFLGAAGIFAKFAKNFPGDISIFENKVIEKVKTNLQGTLIRIKTKQNQYKDAKGQEQTAVNIIGFGKTSDSIEKLEAELFPGSKKGNEGKKEAAKNKPVEEDESF